jgi:hypothetical protein
MDANIENKIRRRVRMNEMNLVEITESGKSSCWMGKS